MTLPDQLPEEHLRLIEGLEAYYLQSEDPIRQSGFGGGEKRSRSRQLAPLDVATVLQTAGFAVAGQSAGGSPLQARFAWSDH
jgi:hypothetical protein